MPIFQFYQNFFQLLKYSGKKAIPLLGIYLEKTLIRKDTCTPMFITALFTIAKTWKQLKHPWTNEWINNEWNIIQS